MKPIKLTQHARGRMHERNISYAQITATLGAPTTKIKPGKNGCSIAKSPRVTVVYVETANKITVNTVYPSRPTRLETNGIYRSRQLTLLV